MDSAVSKVSKKAIEHIATMLEGGPKSPVKGKPSKKFSKRGGTIKVINK